MKYDIRRNPTSRSNWGNFLGVPAVDRQTDPTKTLARMIRHRLGESWSESKTEPDVIIILDEHDLPYERPERAKSTALMRIEMTLSWNTRLDLDQDAEVQITIHDREASQGYREPNRHAALDRLMQILDEPVVWWQGYATTQLERAYSVFEEHKFTPTQMVVDVLDSIDKAIFENVPSARDLDRDIEHLRDWVSLVEGGQAADDVYTYVETLDPERTGAVRSTLEHPIAITQRYIDNASEDELDTFAEKDIRNTLQQLSLEYEKTEPDTRQITRYVSTVAAMLAKQQSFGDRARQILIELGADPPEVIDKIVDELQAGLDLIVETLKDDRNDEIIDLYAEAIPATVETVDTAIEANIKTGALEKFKDDALSGAAKTLGGSAVGGLGWLAQTAATKYGVDPTVIIFTIFDRLLELLTIFNTNWRSDGTDTD